jgi:hypothetical protein
MQHNVMPGRLSNPYKASKVGLSTEMSPCYAFTAGRLSNRFLYHNSTVSRREMGRSRRLYRLVEEERDGTTGRVVNAFAPVWEGQAPSEPAIAIAAQQELRPPKTWATELGRARLRPSRQKPLRLSRSFALPKPGALNLGGPGSVRAGNCRRGSAGASPSRNQASPFGDQDGRDEALDSDGCVRCSVCSPVVALISSSRICRSRRRAHRRFRAGECRSRS